MECGEEESPEVFVSSVIMMAFFKISGEREREREF
jgi:hypothetical protein